MSSHPGFSPDSMPSGDPGEGASPAPEPSPSGHPEGQAPPPPGAPPPPPGAPPPEGPPFGAPAHQNPYGPAPGQFGAPSQQDPYGPAPGQWGAQPSYAAGPPGLPVDPAKARNTATLAHLSAFVGLLGIPSLVGPLIVWLTQREQDPYIDEQGREALNFNISLAIYFVALFAFSFVTLGLGLILALPAFIALGIGWVVFVIIAAMKSSNGEPYRYPLTIRFIS